MRPLPLLAAAGALLLPRALPAAPRASVRTANPARPVRIVVLGSSTAAGAGAKPIERGWVNVYRARLQAQIAGTEVTNLAIGGYTTFHILPTGGFPTPGRPKPDVEHNITKALSLKPDALILNLPSNDVASGVPPALAMRNYEIIAREAALAHVPLWVTSTQPRNMTDPRRRDQEAIRDWLRARFRSHYLDFWTGLADDAGRIRPEVDSGDGIHLNNAGHALIAERAYAAAIPARIAR